MPRLPNGAGFAADLPVCGKFGICRCKGFIMSDLARQISLPQFQAEFSACRIILGAHGKYLKMCWVQGFPALPHSADSAAELPNAASMA